MDENSIPDHKLCGFLCTVLKIPLSHPADLTKTLTPHTPCQLFAGDSEIGFVSQKGIVFSVINPNAEEVVAAECSSRPSSSSVMKKWRRIGLVHGSLSVVHQLHALVNHKCLEIRARVINFAVDEQNWGEIRVVVLVDVYLPIELWSGWQFPRMGSTAAALFRHLRCQEWCRLPVVTPCRHLLCLDCVALNSESCTFPGCGNLYEMQTPEILTRPENPNPKWPVPKDLIELQPSYKQDDWHSDWQSTSSSKVTYLVHKLKELLEANRKIGYSRDDGVDAKGLYETNASAKCSNESCEIPPEKVIIFSQFLEHIHVIEQQLMVADIKFAGMYSPMHSSNKMKSLTTFQHDANCIALLMDGSAALGLDLSFVTHVFLMEPIWDKSMEEQVISRAHRMGAMRPIHVETLAMNGTIEEQMLKFLQDADECRRLLKEEFGKHDRESARGARRTLHDFAESNYLAQLSFVRTVLRLEGI